MKRPQSRTAGREYRLGRRQAQAEKTRARLLAAARRILMTRQGLATFGLESVAKRAGVSRLTVYNQFGSRVGLLEALYDDLARRGRIAERLAAAFQLSDPQATLNGVVAAFAEFWEGERTVIRRLRSMAVLDPAFKGATDRNQRLVGAMRTILLRLTAARGRRVGHLDECARVLAMLTTFETYDALAGPGIDIARATCIVQGLVHAAVEAALR
ncbi:MAG: TetR/AcrR family transcriptional regulator [Steroidobacteraceae bacterium]